ncbi:MAG: AmmeMemoRadiSam system protein B [Thermodesulfobacteriota bacterium]
MRRMPAVAHRFYPGEPEALRRQVEELTAVPPGTKKTAACAVIAPHAGYMFSGRVAGEAFAQVDIPATVLILGPNHHGLGAPVAVMAEGSWEMPLGIVPLDRELAAAILAASPLAVADPAAHQREHSLEVQVPFLQLLQPDLAITPVALGHLPFSACRELGLALAAALKAVTRPVLMVASTDMSHYEPRSLASRMDHRALERVLSLDPEGLYRTVIGERISMCGIIPTTVVLVAARELGATRAVLVRYTDSGETTGDTTQVVGYASLILS